jgi:hypothetical protein
VCVFDRRCGVSLTWSQLRCHGNGKRWMLLGKCCRSEKCIGQNTLIVLNGATHPSNLRCLKVQHKASSYLCTYDDVISVNRIFINICAVILIVCLSCADNNRDVTAYLLQHNICRLPQLPAPPQPVFMTTAAYVHDPVVPQLPLSVARVTLPMSSVHDVCVFHADSPSQLWFVLNTCEVVDEALPKLSKKLTVCYSQLNPVTRTTP